MDRVIITIFGVGLIIGIYWFFFGKKDIAASATAGTISIAVNGGYQPGIIRVKAKQKTELILTRTDTNSCLEEIVIPDFKVKEYLPINKPVTIEITPQHKGEYDIHCGMNMFHGKLIVE